MYPPQTHSQTYHIPSVRIAESFPLNSVTMRFGSILLVTFSSVLPALAQTPERLGVVSFPVSCVASQHAAINRAVALVRDFWYEESQRQFEQVLKADPACAIAHWGIAMSLYRQIWNRPGEAVMTQGWSELQKAIDPKTGREKEYISALMIFYKPGPSKYQQRVDLYSAAMRDLHKHYPDGYRRRCFPRTLAPGRCRPR